MAWHELQGFEQISHGNKPFSLRVPSLVVTRGAGDFLNFMTAMWFSSMGFEPSRMVVAVQRHTYTHQLLQERPEFVMCAPSRAMMEALVLGGRVSGREVNKWEACGLTPMKPTRISVPLVGEAVGNVEYRVQKTIPLDDSMDLVVGEALATHVRSGVMEGEIYAEGADPLVYLGTRYGADGKSEGKFCARFAGIERADYESPVLKKYLTRI